MGLSFVLFIFTFDVPSSIVFMSVFAAGIGLMRPSISSAVSKRAIGGQGFSMGVLQGYDSLGRAIGPALGGMMLDLGLNLGYITATVITAVALVTMVVGSRAEARLAKGRIFGLKWSSSCPSSWLMLPGKCFTLFRIKSGPKFGQGIETENGPTSFKSKNPACFPVRRLPPEYLSLPGSTHYMIDPFGPSCQPDSGQMPPGSSMPRPVIQSV